MAVNLNLECYEEMVKNITLSNNGNDSFLFSTNLCTISMSLHLLLVFTYSHIIGIFVINFGYYQSFFFGRLFFFSVTI